MVRSISALDVCGLLGVFAAVQVYRYLAQRKANPQGLPLPPGPPGKFLIGNLNEMPTSDEWLTYTEWGKKYGQFVNIDAYINHGERCRMSASSKDCSWQRLAFKAPL